MSDLAKIRERLEALRNMTVENGCTEAEALLAAEKMAELLARHGLTEEQLEALGYDEEAVELGSRRDPLEKVWLAVSRFADCTCWISRRQKLAIVYFGRPQDVVIARYVHEVLKRAFDGDQARFKDGEQYRRRRLPKTRRAALKAFTEGWAEEVAGKIYVGLWRRDGGSPAEAMARLDAKEEKLKKAAAMHTGTAFRSCRALAKPKADTKRDRQVGRAAGAKVEVNAGVAAGQVAGLLR